MFNHRKLNIPKKLQVGDTVAIISLSSGMLGNPELDGQRKLMEKRLQELDLQVIYTPHALHGETFIADHPQARAADLIWAFQNEQVKGIIAAIGGEDTYRIIPYLLANEEFQELVQANPKLFIGYSDTTINHLLFYKLGLRTYYGHSAIVDFGELGNQMLPYAREWFQRLFDGQSLYEIKSSPIWYLERDSFAISEIGKERIMKPEEHGFECISGSGKVRGHLLGGCLESLGDLLRGRQAVVNEEYKIFPSAASFQGAILFLETSEEKRSPQELELLLELIETRGVFEVIGGVLIGKPQDEEYYEEYKQVCLKVIGKYGIPILYNINFGHAHPKCILAYGAEIEVDYDEKRIQYCEPLVGM